MTTEDILERLESYMNDAVFSKDSGLFREEILNQCAIFLKTDRSCLVNALRYWIKKRDDERTMIAVRIVKELKLPELKADLEDLKKDFFKGVFPSFKQMRTNYPKVLDDLYLSKINAAINISN